MSGMIFKKPKHVKYVKEMKKLFNKKYKKDIRKRFENLVSDVSMFEVRDMYFELIKEEVINNNTIEIKIFLFPIYKSLDIAIRIHNISISENSVIRITTKESVSYLDYPVTLFIKAKHLDFIYEHKERIFNIIIEMLDKYLDIAEKRKVIVKAKNL